MNAAEKIAHAAERKAFETMLDSLIRKSQTKDVCTVANDFVNMVQKIHSSVWTPETFEMLHQIANAPDSKWAHYAERLLRETYFVSPARAKLCVDASRHTIEAAKLLDPDDLPDGRCL
mgnify:FL=1